MNLQDKLYFTVLFLNILILGFNFKHLHNIYKFFFLFMVYTTIQELSNMHIINMGWKQEIDKNLYFLISIVFWTCFYLNVYKAKFFKQLGLIVAIASISASLILLYKTSFFIEQTYVAFIMAIHSFLLVIIYFLDSVFNPTIHKMHKTLELWVSSGNILWAIFFIIFMGSQLYFYNNSR